MASDINSTILNGRLTRDSEVKFTNGGLAICTFSIASNKRKKVGDQWEDEASFFECTLFGKYGETMSQYLAKGQQVTVQGELQQQRWEKDGDKHSKVVIIVSTVQLLSSPGEKRETPQRTSQASSYKAPPRTAQQPREAQSVAGPELFEGDQIPF